jgi:hypothetical protein
VQGLADVKRLLDLNRLADVAIAERDTDGTDGYASTVDWTNEVRPQVVLDLIAEVLRLRGAIRKADDFLNVVGDPIAAHITLHEAIAEPRGGRFGGDWAEPKPWDDPDVQAWLLRLTNHAGAPHDPETCLRCNGAAGGRLSEAVERIRAHHDKTLGHSWTNRVGYCAEPDGISATYCETGILLSVIP